MLPPLFVSDLCKFMFLCLPDLFVFLCSPADKHSKWLLNAVLPYDRATGGAVKPLANDWREVWSVVRSPPGQESLRVGERSSGMGWVVEKVQEWDS